MKITTTGRKINVTDGLKGYVEKKLSKLDKFFNEDTISQVTLSVQKDDHIIEVTIHHSGMIFRAEFKSSDMYAAIDSVVDILERQIRKQKTRLEKKLKKGAFESYELPDDLEIEQEFNVVKRKKYDSKPMSVEEAILQMNLLGHDFYIFTDDISMDNSVVYRRKDGNYGLIELGK